jgi:hypothetical protein
VFDGVPRHPPPRPRPPCLSRKCSNSPLSDSAIRWAVYGSAACAGLDVVCPPRAMDGTHVACWSLLSLRLRLLERPPSVPPSEPVRLGACDGATSEVLCDNVALRSKSRRRVFFLTDWDGSPLHNRVGLAVTGVAALFFGCSRFNYEELEVGTDSASTGASGGEAGAPPSTGTDRTGPASGTDGLSQGDVRQCFELGIEPGGQFGSNR